MSTPQPLVSEVLQPEPPSREPGLQPEPGRSSAGLRGLPSNPRLPLKGALRFVLGLWG